MARRNRLTTTIGIDLGDKVSHLCILGDGGEVELETTVTTSRAAFLGFFEKRRRCRVVLEASAQSRWTSQLLAELGYEVVVANPRQLPLIYGQTRKNDPLDARRLAELGQFKVELLHPVTHRSDAAQLGLVAIKAREGLVHARTRLVNTVRSVAKAFGERVPKVHTAGFHTKARETLSEDLLMAVGGLLDALAVLHEHIRAYDRQLQELAREVYPETVVLQQVTGVGPITSLAYVLTIEDPSRFSRSRDVGSYLGLVPKQDQSGKTDKALSITKAGDRVLRRLLVQSAQYILGPFGPDCDLRRWGLKKAGDSKIDKRRAIVAVARRLAVLLHRLWVTGEVYQPLGHAA
jgi:transposase